METKINCNLYIFFSNFCFGYEVKINSSFRRQQFRYFGFPVPYLIMADVNILKIVVERDDHNHVFMIFWGFSVTWTFIRKTKRKSIQLWKWFSFSYRNVSKHGRYFLLAYGGVFVFVFPEYQNKELSQPFWTFPRGKKSPVSWQRQIFDSWWSKWTNQKVCFQGDVNGARDTSKTSLGVRFRFRYQHKIDCVFWSRKILKEPEFYHDGHTSRRSNGKSVRNGCRVR